MTQPLHLILTTDSIEKHCAVMKAQAQSSSHLLTALMMLQSCIFSHVPAGNQNDPAYRNIKALLEHHAAAARQGLLEETSALLRTALMEQDRSAIQRAHAALSRNGFWQAVALAAHQTDPEQLIQATNWLASWYKEKKSRAQAASPYPDCLDFKGAGIDQKEYAAMDETRCALDAACCS